MTAAERLRSPLLHLFLAQIFLMRGDCPNKTERIPHMTVSVSPELILDRESDFASCRQRLGPRRIRIRNVQMENERKVPLHEGRHVEFFGEIVREHHHRVADAHLRMHEFPARSRRAADFHSIESALQEIDVSGGAFNIQMCGNGVKSRWYRTDCF
jgi:hypothetical protein